MGFSPNLTPISLGIDMEQWADYSEEHQCRICLVPIPNNAQACPRHVEALRIDLATHGRVYNTIHQWNLRHWPKTGICEHCGHARKTDWSNVTGNYLYKVRSDWQELCRWCHKAYDAELRKINVLLALK